MKATVIAAFDISKVSTGVAIYDGEFQHLQTIKFNDSVQWENEVKEIFDIWKPDIVTFSDTVNRMFSHGTKSIMFGLMYHLQHICCKYMISCNPITDAPAKKHIGVKMNKGDKTKQDTINWAYQFASPKNHDEADAMCFAVYVYDLIRCSK